MADMFSKKRRSEIMSKIRSKNTGAERLVFRHLRAKGLHFQKHYKGAPGSPDIALPKKKLAVFIDGDFWHGRHLNRLLVKGTKNYWVMKITTNIKRDRRQRAALKKGGWKILKVWESDLKRVSTRYDQLLKVEKFIKN
ncbi:MAG: very short patch repair endonuclease [Patescibacteria group bacterium]|nr:MAG: very short patch repair endonuclease [Patescibacteria group bacterium]